MVLFGAFFFFCSCVDHNYDLVNKEILTDVKIEGNKIALPIGSLKAVALNSLINVDEIDILKKGEDGVYSINKEDNISIEESIDPITLGIDPINESMSMEFNEAKITDVHIDGKPMEPAVFNTPTISLDELNSKLPVLKSNVNKGVANAALDQAFDYIESGAIDPSFLGKIPLDETIKIENQSVDFSFEYKLPEQVETINNIKLGSRIEVIVTHPAALQEVNKSIDFEITFPDMFILSLDNNASHKNQYTISADKHTIGVKGLIPSGNSTPISFYIDKLDNIESLISNGTIKVSEEILYTISYSVNGQIVPSKNMKREDFQFNVSINVPLKFEDIHGKTKDIQVEFNPINIEFAGKFDNLKHIDRIDYIEFDKEKSHVKFETRIGGDWFQNFILKEGYALKMEFPDNLDICDENSTYNGKGTEIIYNPNEHAFFIYDLRILANTNWDLSLEKLTLYKDIDKTDENNYVCEINDVKANITFIDPNNKEIKYLVLAGCEFESLATTLDNLKGEKQAEFTMHGADLVVKDAVVQTEVIHVAKEIKSSFELNEEVPSEIGRIESIGFKNDVAMNFDLEITGLSNLNTDINLDLQLNMPSFLKLKKSPKNSSDIDITIEDGFLEIKTDYNPTKNKKLEFELICSEIDFRKEFGNEGLLPMDSIGNKYIKYKDDIEVYGDVSIRGMEFHSTVLESLNEIKMDVNFVIDDIEVETFHGIYSGEIDNIEESLDLDLGDELAFLKEEGNTITLAEPQLEFVIENTIGIPVDVNLELFCKDDKGETIPTSQINTQLSILPADYNEETGEISAKETKIFITSDTVRVSKVGYNNVEIPNLANLLEKVPSSIDFKITPIIKKDQTHHVNIGEPIKLNGSYAVVIPLKFDNFNMCYSDTISGLKGSLEETLDMVSNVSLTAKMDIINTIPLGLKLKVTPLNEKKEVIDYITIDDLTINAGLGGDIVNSDGTISEQEAQQFVFSIKSEKADISELDKLAFSIEAATTDHTVGGKSLRDTQGIKISNIVFEVGGDIAIDLKK